MAFDWQARTREVRLVGRHFVSGQCFQVHLPGRVFSGALSIDVLLKSSVSSPLVFDFLLVTSLSDSDLILFTILRPLL